MKTNKQLASVPSMYYPGLDSRRKDGGSHAHGKTVSSFQVCHQAVQLTEYASCIITFGKCKTPASLSCFVSIGVRGGLHRKLATRLAAARQL